MEATLPVARRAPRLPLAALGKLTIGALAGTAAVLVYLQAAMFGFAPPLAVFAAVALLVAGAVGAGWRWAPALGALVCGLMFALNGPFMLMALAEPGIQGIMYAVSVVTLALLALGVVAGIGATAQNYRGGERALPRALSRGLLVAAGLVVGAALVGSLPQSGVASGISPDALAGLPALGAKNWEFDQKEIRVRAGETVVLQLPNADPEAHYLDIDELNVHAPMPAGQTGVAIFTAPEAAGTYIFYCHPHANKETGEGMVGTLIVE